MPDDQFASMRKMGQELDRSRRRWGRMIGVPMILSGFTFSSLVISHNMLWVFSLPLLVFIGIGMSFWAVFLRHQKRLYEAQFEELVDQTLAQMRSGQ